ncbi:TfoX/Sxy family protein [Undibacterium sp. Jales W-56]|uniref:TfoX/Sxy family protein n=1 Tax=Undibacterium sp. Jales W-56 TaxID=2897325 RepID=UPI0021D1FD6F|nr:TfoX/Sxy family protein [Undibacterium sp. Jales W-56]MCU6434650.1 TfoX/Sxy family protein [Undibacterium sp. Jales W-56]
MSTTSQFVDYVRELLAPLAPFSDSKFFGGQAMKYQGIQFAMIMGNTLYFRVNAETRPEYEKRGSLPFSYHTKKGRIEVRKFYSLPEELFEQPEELVAWARQAIMASEDK